MATEASKYTLEQATNWLTDMGKKGIYGGASARIRSTAIEQLATVIGSDEPSDVQSVLDNIGDITDRWATKNHANPSTAQTYRTRAKATLEAFLEYQRDPTGFRPRRKAEASEGTKRPEKKAAKAPDSDAADANAPGQGRTYPVSSGEFWYRLPPNGVTQKDVFRIACHLATLAIDFDPVASSGLFALAKTEKAA